MSLLGRIGALLGISAYFYSRPALASVSSEQLDRTREQYNGQIQPLPTPRVTWFMAHLAEAEIEADRGALQMPAQLMRSARKDGIYSGVLATRTSGLVRLPKRFRGNPEQVAQLEIGHDRVRSVFDEMCPSSELALLAADGIELGVGIAELCPVPGRHHPILRRLDPEFLTYRWNENRWYFASVAGPVAIHPGDGRWVLHAPGGRQSPWHHGLWRAIGRAYIRKEHAALYKDNWEAKLANPARVAVSPAGASEEQQQSWFQRVMAWGVNSVFGLSPGYDVKLLESNGRGYDSFVKTIADQNQEMIVAVAGQTVTTDGGAGFQNSDIHKSIRADLIKETADSLAYTINTQVLPHWVASIWGESALAEMAVVEWDVTPPKDRSSEAQALVAFANALKGLTEALQPYEMQPAVKDLCVRFGVSVEALKPAREGPEQAANQPPEAPRLEAAA